jgi:hypothetical protein
MSEEARDNNIMQQDTMVDAPVPAEPTTTVIDTAPKHEMAKQESFASGPVKKVNRELASIGVKINEDT